MPPEPPAGASASSAPDALTLIVLSEAFERVHYALVLASGAAAIGRPVTLFFTDAALHALRRPDASGTAGWQTLPSLRHPDGGAADAALQARGVGGFEELLAACESLGATIIACEMGLRAIGLAQEDLRDDIEITLAGVVTMFAVAPHGAMLAL